MYAICVFNKSVHKFWLIGFWCWKQIVILVIFFSYCVWFCDIFRLTSTCRMCNKRSQRKQYLVVCSHFPSAPHPPSILLHQSLTYVRVFKVVVFFFKCYVAFRDESTQCWRKFWSGKERDVVSARSQRKRRSLCPFARKVSRRECLARSSAAVAFLILVSTRI